jgi:hypothetical protein
VIFIALALDALLYYPIMPPFSFSVLLPVIS